LKYGQQTKNNNLITAAETRFVRPVKGCSRFDRFQNDDTRNELIVTSITQHIEKHRER
jgi:hypothetical protein